MKEKNKKFHFSVGEIISWVVAAIGVIISFIASKATATNGIEYFVFALICSEIVVVLIWAWVLFDSIRKKKEIEQATDIIDELKKGKEELISKLETERKNQEIQRHDMLKKMSIISLNIKNVSKLDNDFCTRIPKIAERSYYVLDTLQKNGLTDMKKHQDEIMYALDDFANSLYDLYKRYISKR